MIPNGERDKDTEQLCITCSKLFVRPEYFVTVDSVVATTVHNENTKLLIDELRTSAEADCCLCTLVWEDFLAQYQRLDSPDWEINEKTIIKSSLSWELPLGEESDGTENDEAEDDRTEDDESRVCARLTYFLRPGGDGDSRLHVNVNVWPESAIAEAATRPNQIPSNSASNAVSLAKSWLNECIQNHVECQVENSGWLPTRLIDVGSADALADPKLVLSADVPKDSTLPLYIALSHRWGASTVFRLETTNQDELMVRIPMERLSTTFQQAIQFARVLDIPYIWIDSLCIAQDSSSDWRTESLVMNKVYKHSICNIAASAASDTTGFYQLRDRQTINSMMTARRRIQRKNHDGVYVLSLSSNEFFAAPPGPLYTRGWVFQERLLSPRSLHFSTQLFWECRTLRACETYPKAMPQNTRIWSFHNNAKNWENKLCAENSRSLWQELVQSYVSCDLTFPTDRIVALAGVAEEFRSIIDDEYLAGLWKTHLPQSLVWTVSPRNWWDREKADPFPTRPATYRCPTWSWASLDFKTATINEPMNIPFGTMVLAHVVCTPVESSTNNPFTTLDSSFIVLQGLLGKTSLELLETVRAHGIPYWLDLGPQTFAADSVMPQLYVMPILRQFQDVHGLLLRKRQYAGGSDRVSGGNDDGLPEGYERVGIVKMSIHPLKRTVPNGMEWVEKFARLANPFNVELDMIVIY